MNVIFITLSNINSIEERGIYPDLLRKFRDEGHKVCIVSPSERRNGQRTHVNERNGVTILKVRTLNIQKTNVVEKGIGTLMIEGQFKRAIQKHLGDVKFDLILYSTPPITFTNVVRYLKKENPQAISYLLLKDIFPQNAVDLGMLVASPISFPKGIEIKTALMNLPKYMLYRFFRNKEKRLYAQSDHIGCMSPANIKYVLKHNSEISPYKVELAPNSYERREQTVLTDAEYNAIREKYNLPTDRPIFIYGGNLGKPQGIPFLIQCLEANKNRNDCHFVIVGKGTEYKKLETWFKTNKPKNVTLFQTLPKREYDHLVMVCNIGMIFLDYRFTIPNYPSRLLPYLMEKKPIIAATDPNCDTGSLAEQNGYGFWCPSNDVQAFSRCVDKILKSNLVQMGENGYQYFLNNYTVDHTYRAIVSHINKHE